MSAELDLTLDQETNNRASRKIKSGRCARAGAENLAQEKSHDELKIAEPAQRNPVSAHSKSSGAGN
jgi:hypothetical protein